MATYKDVILVSENTIKKNLAIDKNLDYSYIAPIAKATQDISLQQSIGSVLYDKIRQDVFIDPTLSGHTSTKTLLDDYIKDYLLYAILAELQVQISYKTRNIGIAQNTDDNAVTPAIADINYLKNYYKNFAEFYKTRLQSYLCANYVTYPEYTQWRNQADLISNENKFNCPIVLGKPYRRNNRG